MTEPMNAPDIAKVIKQKQAECDRLKFEINEIAREHIPDFHFLDYKVSTFWTCEKSPIGMCVWKIALESDGYNTRPMNDWSCRYCGGPVERK